MSTKITELRASNVKRIKAVEIHPRGAIVEITGKNGQGKSSILDSIAMALGGKAYQGAEPIRKGSDRGKIVVTLDSGIVITRTMTEKTDTLEVRSADGAKYPSPQAMLDKLVGELSFDPLEFVSMKPGEQRDLLKKLVGVDTADLDQSRKQTYEERTLVNRTIGQLQARTSGLQHDASAPPQEVSVAKLMEEMQAGEALNAAADKAAEFYRLAKNAETQWASEVDKLKRQLAEAEERLKSATEEAARADAAATEAREKRVDLAPIKERIQSSEATNAKVRANVARSALMTELQAAEESAARMTKRIEAIDQEKVDRLAAAKFPVAGLSFDETGVMFNGIPFSQASSAEQIRVSVAMGLAMNPTLKVLLIRNGSLMDEDALALVAEMAEAAGAQVWIERVDSSGSVGIVIEDGMVKTVNTPVETVPVEESSTAAAAV